MSWPIPTPNDLRDQAETDLEAALADVTNDQGQGVASKVISAAVRSGKTVLAAICRVIAMALYPLHLHLRWWGDQYFPDTATEENLERHAAIWGVFRLPATTAGGDIVVEGAAPGITIPARIEYRTNNGGQIYRTTKPVTVAANGTATLPVRSIVTGEIGNQGAGVTLVPVAALAGLPEKAIVAAAGLSGGAELESPAGLLTRFLERIREPGHGGNDADYVKWAKINKDVIYIRSYGGWTGIGSVGIVIGMAGPRAPTATESASIYAAVKAAAPITITQISIVPAAMRPIDLTIRALPDTDLVRAAIAKAAALHFLADAAIAGTIHPSRVSETISAADGEYAHTLIQPAEPVVCGRTEIPVLGAITWLKPVTP